MKTLATLLFVSLAAHGQTSKVVPVQMPHPAPSKAVKPHVVPVDLSTVIPAPPVAIVRKVEMPKPVVPAKKIIAIEASK